MSQVAKIPLALRSAIDSEANDFLVKAGRSQPFKKSLTFVLFGLFWTAFTSIFVVAFLGPLFLGKEVHFESNGVPTVASPQNLDPIIVPALIIGLFVLIGLSMIGFGIYTLLQKGGYFVGTPTRLINYRKGKLRSIDWEQFSGDIEVTGNDHKGSIALQLRTGRWESSKNSSGRFVPEVVYISAIPDAFDLARICRKRIKENDPTPPVVNPYE